MQHSVPQSRSARLHRMRVAGNTLEASCCRTCRRRCAKRRLRRLLAADGGWARWARCLAPNMGRTIVGNGDVGRGNPGAIGGRERREQPRRPLPPGVLTGFSGRVRASVYFPMFPRPRSWMTPGDGPPTSAAVSTLPPRPPPGPLGLHHRSRRSSCPCSAQDIAPSRPSFVCGQQTPESSRRLLR